MAEDDLPGNAPVEADPPQDPPAKADPAAPGPAGGGAAAPNGNGGPATSSDGGWLDAINRRIVVLGTVAASIVALGGQLNSCSEQKVQRYAAFRSAVATEEAFWKDRFADYVAIAAEANDAVRRRKELALQALAAHGVPDFTEYNIATIDGHSEIKLAHDRLTQMSKDLVKAMATSDDPVVAKDAQAAVAFDDGQSALAQRVVDDDRAPAPANPEAPPKFGIVAPSGTTNPATQVLVHGNPKGWDIDVFWCAGGPLTTETANYSAARQAAWTLAQTSSQGAKLGDSVFLGQIRLRPLPLLRQGGGYPSPGSRNTLRAEADSAEQGAAQAVLGRLSGQGFTLASSGTPTKWYLSLFVCSANAPAAAAAPQPVSGNRATAS